MPKPFPMKPGHPERICWGCDKYCAADNLFCGDDTCRAQHPIEVLGEDWYLHGDWQLTNSPVSEK